MKNKEGGTGLMPFKKKRQYLFFMHIEYFIISLSGFPQGAISPVNQLHKVLDH